MAESVMTGKTVLKPSQVMALIESRINHDIKRPVMVEGAPGVGKTQIMQQIANKISEASGEEFGFIAVHTPTLSPEDMGVPGYTEDRSGIEFKTPNKTLPFVNSDFPERGILLIDELAQGDKATQKGLGNLLQERTVHGNPIKDGWFMVATGNRVQDRAGASQILSHVRNRMTTVEMNTNLDDWITWFQRSKYFKPEVAAFLRWKPELLNNFDPNHAASATPRAWAEGIAPTIGSVTPDLEFAAFEGDIGDGPANEFIAFLQIYRDLPDLNKVLASPDKHKADYKANVKYALCGALAAKADKKNFGAVIEYTTRLGPEYGVCAIKEAISQKRELEETKEFVKWAVASRELLY